MWSRQSSRSCSSFSTNFRCVGMFGSLNKVVDRLGALNVEPVVRHDHLVSRPVGAHVLALVPRAIDGVFTRGC